MVLCVFACREKPPASERATFSTDTFENRVSETDQTIDFCSLNKVGDQIWGIYFNRGEKAARSYAVVKAERRILQYLAGAGRDPDGTWSLDARSNLILVRIQNCRPAGEPSYLQEFRFDENLGYLTFRENAGGGDRRFHGLYIKLSKEDILATIDSEQIIGTNTVVQVWKFSEQKRFNEVTNEYFESIPIREFMTVSLAKALGDVFTNEQFPSFTGVFAKVDPKNLRITFIMDNYPGHYPPEIGIGYDEIQRGLRSRNFLWSQEKRRFVLEK